MSEALSKLAAAQGQGSFVEGYQFTEPESLGILIAHHFEWDGGRIMTAFMYALEDANYHTEAGKVSDWIGNDLFPS